MTSISARHLSSLSQHPSLDSTRFQDILGGCTDKKKKSWKTSKKPIVKATSWHLLLALEEQGSQEWPMPPCSVRDNFVRVQKLVFWQKSHHDDSSHWCCSCARAWRGSARRLPLEPEWRLGRARWRVERCKSADCADEASFASAKMLLKLSRQLSRLDDWVRDTTWQRSCPPRRRLRSIGACWSQVSSSSSRQCPVV